MIAGYTLFWKVKQDVFHSSLYCFTGGSSRAEDDYNDYFLCGPMTTYDKEWNVLSQRKVDTTLSYIFCVW